MTAGLPKLSKSKKDAFGYVPKGVFLWKKLSFLSGVTARTLRGEEIRARRIGEIVVTLIVVYMAAWIVGG